MIKIALVSLTLCALQIASAQPGFLREKTEAQAMPPPFSRELSVEDPYLQGTDVYILQNFLNRIPHSDPIATDSTYGPKTAAKVKQFQKRKIQKNVLFFLPLLVLNICKTFTHTHTHKESCAIWCQFTMNSAEVSLPATGTVDATTARRALSSLSRDGYKWDPSKTPGQLGYKYLVHIPVHHNRSIETTATLYSANGTVLFLFQVRAHGHTQGGSHAWPNFNNSGPGLNEFSSDGNTPTGLFEFDLNSPESIPKLYGPYPVNRAVKGLKGNGEFLIPKVRHGILMHTGEWHEYAGWNPPEPMPNSEGCIHAWPDSIKQVWQLLVNECGK